MDDLLKYAIENGMIDLSHIQEQVNMSKRKEVLKKHPYKIWEGKNGKWYTYLPDDKGGRVLKKRSTQRALEDEVIAYWKTKEENPTLEEIFHEWNDRRLELKKISQSSYIRYRQTFDRHYKEFGKRKIKSLEVEDFLDFLEEQIPKYNLSAKSFAGLKTVTIGMLKRAKRRKLIDFSVDDILEELDVTETEFKKTVKEDCEEVFDEKETELMILYLITNQDIWNLGILLMFVTGLRVGELVALQWDCFHDDAVQVRRTETRIQNPDGKDDYIIKEFPKTEAGWRIVAIPQAFQWIKDALQKVSDGEQYVFEKGGYRMTTNCFRRRLGRVCDKVGIPRRSPHKIRKTYCTILFDSKVDTKLITDQMGHTDIICSEVHYHRNRKDLDEKIKAISAIPEFRQRLTLIAQ